MAYTVNVEQVTAVRIDGEWAAIQEGSFEVDSLAWAQGGQEVGSREMGFHAVLSGGGGVLAAPLSSLQGVRHQVSE